MPNAQHKKTFVGHCSAIIGYRLDALTDAKPRFFCTVAEMD